MARIASPHRLRADLGARLVLALLACGTGACNEIADGSLTLVIDQTDLALDPLADPRVTRLALYDDDTGDSLGDAPLRLGGRTRLTAVAPGTRNLRLEALSATNQVLAAARAFDVRLASGRSQEIPLHLRKPLVYVGGGAEIQVSDSAASGIETGALDPIPLAGVRAMATTRGGELLVAALEDASGYSLVWIDTATHTERGRAPLGAPVRSIFVHPLDRYAVVLQTLNDIALVVDLPALVTGTNLESAFRPVSVPRPHSAAFDEDDDLWVISATPANCDTPGLKPGQLLHIDREGNQREAPVALPSLASDIGLNPVTGRPLVALACAGKLMELQDRAFVEVAAIRGLGDVVIDGSTLFTVGWEPPTEPDFLPGVVSVLDLKQPGGGRQVVFPIESVPLTLGEQDSHGNYKYLYIEAVSLAPRAVSVTSHGGRVAFLHTITYSLVTDLNDPVTGLPLCAEFAISLVEQGLTLVDVETGQIVWTRPTSFDNQCLCDRVNRGVCIQDLEASLDGPAYTPTALTILTGGK
ncbi:MAG: hypothetical protein HY906_13200 [Deltaproteobacteria bacterium]|nr:hypothetical protein [Deltaproteobacteria bacterium]